MAEIIALPRIVDDDDKQADDDNDNDNDDVNDDGEEAEDKEEEEEDIEDKEKFTNPKLHFLNFWLKTKPALERWEWFQHFLTDLHMEALGTIFSLSFMNWQRR